MWKVMVLLLILATPGFSYARTDYQCVSDCTQKGHMYSFCTSQCSYDDNPYQTQQPNNGQNQIQLAGIMPKRLIIAKIFILYAIDNIDLDEF